MSVASLENSNLTLVSLTVNNSQYAEASGYVPAQTIIGTTNTTSTLYTPNISSSFITASTVNFTGANTSEIYLNTDSSNNLQLISDSPAGGLEIFNETGNVLLTSGAANNLTVGTTATGGSIFVKGIITGTLFNFGSVNTEPMYISVNSSNNFQFITESPAGGLSIFNDVGSGTLSVNASNQLLWNGVVIS